MVIEGSWTFLILFLVKNWTYWDTRTQDEWEVRGGGTQDTDTGIEFAVHGGTLAAQQGNQLEEKVRKVASLVQ